MQSQESERKYISWLINVMYFGKLTAFGLFYHFMLGVTKGGTVKTQMFII